MSHTQVSQVPQVQQQKSATAQHSGTIEEATRRVLGLTDRIVQRSYELRDKLDSLYGPLPEDDGAGDERGRGVPSPSGRVWELLGALSGLDTAVYALGVQVDRAAAL